MEFIKKVSESRLFTLKSFDRLVYNLTHRVLRIYNFNKYKHKIILIGGEPKFYGFVCMKKKILLRIIAGAFTLCSMAFIFYNSALPAEQSGELSVAVTGKVDGVINPEPSDSSGSEAATPSDPSAPVVTEEEKKQEKEARIKKLDPIIRKIAHILEFATFTFFAAIFATTFDMKSLVRFSIVFALCGIYALSDEIHQYFVPGRVCDIKDVALDVTGVFISAAMVCLFYELYRRKAAKKANISEHEENTPVAV